MSEPAIQALLEGRCTRACDVCWAPQCAVRRERALHARDFIGDGFRWVVADDRAQSVFARLRMAP